MTIAAADPGTARAATDECIRVVGFDLDGTLAESKSAMGPVMAGLLEALLDRMHVLIISGGAWPQFEGQVLGRLSLDADRAARLHLMPTCGTSYLQWGGTGWETVYAHDLDPDVRARIAGAIEASARELGVWEPEPYGDRIEDRGSQITFSALGQQAPLDEKHTWDPDGTKRRALRARVAARLPDLEVRAGGSTSIDVTEQGIDKAFGLSELMARLGASPDEVLFVGDALHPGGNDHPVKRLGVATHPVEGPDDTVRLIQQLLAA